MRVETGWILFAQEKKLIQCPRRKKSRRLKKVWQCFGFNFRRPLPLWYFYWGSLYKPLVNYWGQPTFILKMRPNIKTFPNWIDHQTVWKHKRIFFNLQNTTVITNDKHKWYVVVFHQGVAMKIQKKEEFLQKKTTVTYVGLQVVALTKILLGLSVDTGKCSQSQMASISSSSSQLSRI